MKNPRATHRRSSASSVRERVGAILSQALRTCEEIARSRDAKLRHMNLGARRLDFFTGAQRANNGYPLNVVNNRPESSGATTKSMPVTVPFTVMSAGSFNVG